MVNDENIIDKDISELTKEELLNSSFIPSIFENYEGEERNEVLKEVLVVAKDKKVFTKVKHALDSYKKMVKLESVDGNALLYMNISGNKKEDTTIENYVQAILNTSELVDSIKYNEFTGKMERVGKNGEISNWTDDDDAWVLNVIENKYGICDIKKYTAGLSLCKNKLKYHPIKDKIESIKWDGKSRIDKFLSNIMNCEDDDYSREVSRMIFYGGISRLYNPGCKFDYMVILVGEQGTCKSTIVDWLSMGTNSYREIMNIEGKDSAEVLRYGWICEFSELLAMIRNRMVETMKAFVTRQVDTYRSAYARNFVDIPRHCIFIGTTNSYQFLIDKTGNRRYLPITINLSKGELYAKRDYVMNYIEQCWAEALELYKKGEIYLVIPSKYNAKIDMYRDKYMEDDPQQGLVAEYLHNKKVGDKVCVLEIYTKALNNLQKKCSRFDSIKIGNYMREFKNWEMGKSNTRFKEYGIQRYWLKTSNDDNEDLEEVEV